VLYGLAMDEKVTKPTIETVLERMAGMEERLNQRISMSEDRVNGRMDAMEGRLNQRISMSEERVNQRMDGLEERLSQRMDGIEVRMGGLEERLSQRMDGLEVGMDRTRSVVFELRADFRELTVKLKEHLPELR